MREMTERAKAETYALRLALRLAGPRRDQLPRLVAEVLGASATHSCPQSRQRNLTTITSGRSHVPAENGQPIEWRQFGQSAGYADFIAALI